ncbi:MAG: glycoside hydrolase domain-containing protein [Gemmatimonadota bacterium]
MDVGGYSPAWRAATAARPGGWTAEVVIPYAALDLAAPPPAGEVWRANFCQDSSAGFSSAVTWSFTAGNFSDPAGFGELAFTGSPRALRQERLAGFTEGRPAVSFSLVGDFQPIVTVVGQLRDASGSSIYRNEMRLRDTRSVDLTPPALTTGSYTLALDGRDEHDRSVFSQGLSFRTAKAFDLAVSNYPHAGYTRFAVDVRGIPDPVQSVVVRLTAPDGRLAGQAVIADLEGGRGEARLPSRDLPPGEYEVEARALAADGAVLESARQALRLFPLPSWWGNDLGLDHSVPPPFGPVQVSGGRLSVWGRDYDFGRGAVPLQIRSQGRELLAGPPRFRCRAGGQLIDLAALEASPGDSFPDAVSRVASAPLPGGGSVSLKATVEFDGFVRLDVTLAPGAPVLVDELTLELPLAPALGQFLMTSNGATSNIVPLQEDFSGAFLPYLWIGNDAMGLAWTAERDQFWRPRPDRALEVLAGPDAVLFRVNLMAEAGELTAPAAFSFALMATPVRPIPRNDPFACPAYEATGSFTFSEFLVYPLPAGLTPEQGTVEFWVQRTALEAPGNTALLSIGPVNEGVTAYLLSPDQPDAIALLPARPGAAPLLTGRAAVPTDGFAHLAFSWSREEIRLHVDGTLAAQASGAAADSFRAALAAAGSQVRFGCGNTYHGYTGIVVDEIRISSVPRYGAESFQPPRSPFSADASALVLDHLDDRFRPDGQDAETGGGGVPSIGSRFVAARFEGGLRMEVAPARPAYEVLRDYGVGLFTHWLWQREMPLYYGQPVLHDDDRVVPGLAAQLAEAHRYGIESIPYMAYPAISSTSGLIEPYGDEWQILPVSTTPWPVAGAPPGYHFLNCCANARSYADYFASGTAWVMDEYGFDGFYSDGLASVVACQNEAHGCGYRDADGRLRATWPVYGIRETLKRMYRIVKAREPQGWVANHSSFNLLIPLLSFSDVVYTGEHEDYENLQTARLRFNGEPWGVYVTLLGSGEHVYSPLHAMTPLLSGSSVWGTGMVARNDQGRKDAAMRAAYRAFDTTSAQWVPWWRGEAGPCRPQDPGIRASLYAHPGRGLLILAANYNPDRRRADIALDLAAFGLAGRALTATNALTDQALALSPDGLLTAAIAGKSFVLVRVE